MKWRGRRQTTNVIDLRGTGGVAAFSIKWGDSGDIVIDTDGVLYGKLTGGSHNVNISLVIPNPPTSRITDWAPTMTIGQKDTLRELVNLIAVNATVETVQGASDIDDVVLVQYVQSIINSAR